MVRREPGVADMPRSGGGRVFNVLCLATMLPAANDTPLMRQWREVKAHHRDALVLFRVGDFYELFFGDAQEGAKLLGLTLTSRNNGGAGRVPMAGVPTKALDEYVARLIRLGKRVAVCEQMEDPAEAKGLVRREVVETVTPGTVVSEALLDAKRNNFVAALVPDDRATGIAALDVSTGELVVLEAAEGELEAEIDRLEPKEVLVPASAGALMADDEHAVRTVRPDWTFDADTAREELVRRYRVQSLHGFGFEEGDGLLVRAAGALVAYVEEIRPGCAKHMQAPRIQRSDAVMTMDSMTRRNLELVEPLRPYDGDECLLSVLDATVTPMGGRLLRTWLLRPLLNAAEIARRHAAVAELHESPGACARLRSCMSGIRDMDRLCGRIASARVAPREVLSMGHSMLQLPRLREAGAVLKSDMTAQLIEEMDPLEDLAALVSEAISEDAPAALSDGGVIRHGFDRELDEMRSVRDSARDFIAGLQTREREKTGIGSLKVGYNKVFGYFLEVTKPNLARVPEHYTRRQTLTNAERFYTPELKEWEDKVFGAEDKIGQMEKTLFSRIREQLSAAGARIRGTSRAVAVLDTLAAFADVARRRVYVRPEITTGFGLDIEAGRHPVVETMMRREDFIPNDLRLDAEARIAVLTGPNMAGKSTVLRQAGLIQVMAQTGSFVPADRARLAICDRVFTRVGASDNLVRGQSTFMVEMNETAAIIHGSTSRSLVLLDEIGRGTSTYDGVSIAWAVTEHLHDKVGAKAIFATHYHELTQLADLLPAVKNLNVAVRESGDEILFLRRLETGGADRSYGIQVARLAGFPPHLIERAKDLLSELEGALANSGSGRGLGRGERAPESRQGRNQLSLFVTAEHPALAKLRTLDPDQMTPLEALNTLHTVCRIANDQ